MQQPDALSSELYQLETALLHPEVRHGQTLLASLLADEFQEFGSSGRIYTKQETIDAIATEQPARFSIVSFTVTLLAVDVTLVRYQAVRRDESGQVASTSLRSSIWIRRDDRWQVLFHQGTKV